MRKLTLAVALTSLAIAGSAHAQAVVPAPPGSKAEGVEFLGNIPINGSVGANFKTVGDTTYMFVTGALGAAKFDPGLAGGLNYGGLFVYDISTDPESPALVSHLPMPHYESEDVSIGGDRLLISGDGTQGGSNLVVIDIADPTLPTVEKVINMNVLGEGHTATCIQDCHYVWVAGDNTIHVIDLEGTPDIPSPLPGVIPDLSAESTSVEIGAMEKQPQFGWAVHDVQVDDAGIAWVVGGNGTVGFDVNPGAYGQDNLLAPTVVASTGEDAFNSGGSGGLGPDGSTVNDFIHHNSFRPNADKFVPRTAENLMDPGLKPGEKVLITEEDIWMRPLGVTRGGCKTQGSFQVWQVKQYDGRGTDGATKFLGEFKTEYNDELGLGALPTQDIVASEGFCSSHYFDTQQGSGNLTAVAWYAQGTRFVDTTDPTNPKQVGYFMAPDSTVWATYFSPVDKNIVYTMDHQRGIDVLKIAPGGTVAKHRKVRAPYMKWWRSLSTRTSVAAPTFGWVCPLAI